MERCGTRGHGTVAVLLCEFDVAIVVAAAMEEWVAMLFQCIDGTGGGPLGTIVINRQSLAHGYQHQQQLFPQSLAIIGCATAAALASLCVAPLLSR